MKYSILIIDDEENFREGIAQYLSQEGYETFEAESVSTARSVLSKNAVDIILLDVQLGKEYGPSLLSEINRMRPTPKTIIITAYGEVDIAVNSMKNGAFDFLSKPIDFTVLQTTLKHAEDLISLQRELERLRNSDEKKFSYVIGKNSKMEQVFRDASRAAKAGASVLIYGETGVGKEILAKYIHKNGSRSNKPLVAINCAALQPTVLESELFGHEAGAFTGAIQKTQGLIEVADGGILFLDEISSMSMDMQSKILRAIEEKRIRRVGGTKEIPVDVQIIAATNKDLLMMIEQGNFRDDLYFRLRVVDIDIPPLRERIDDIPEFSGFFIKMINQERGLNIIDVDPSVIMAFQKYQWPGNLRELRNVLERASIFCDGETIRICDIPNDISSLVK